MPVITDSMRQGTCIACRKEYCAYVGYNHFQCGMNRTRMTAFLHTEVKCSERQYRRGEPKLLWQIPAPEQAFGQLAV